MAGGDERFVVDEEGARLDVALAARSRIGSRKKARIVLEGGKVSVDGEPVGRADAGQALSAGAEVVIAWNRPGTGVATRKGRSGLDKAGLTVLYEDTHLVAVDKPPFLLTDAATARQRREEDTVRKRLARWLQPQGEGAWPCHRIDRDTSGVVLFARDEATQQAARDLFAAHVPERVYLAFVEGEVRGESGTWTDWMAWDPKQRRMLVVSPGTEGALEARADWTLLDAFGPVSLVRVSLHTGRRNQIRVHLQARRMCLVGERQYRPLGIKPVTRALERQALHAHRLALPHPVTGEPLEIVSKLPSDLRQLQGWLRKRMRQS